MLYEMKNVISSHFSNFFCSFAPRTCNKVAHALAAEGLRSQGANSRWEGTLSFIFDLVASYLAVSMS
jgi:hypothetical protein